jgi:hypothetical protein
MLLKVGRHLRPRPGFKLIVGREEGENRYLEGYRKRFVHMFPVSHKGPLVLLDGVAGSDDLELAARITARFSHGRDDDEVTIAVTAKEGATRNYKVIPLPSDQIPPEWYV